MFKHFGFKNFYIKNYNNIFKGSSKKLFNVCKKAEPVAPSTTL